MTQLRVSPADAVTIKPSVAVQTRCASQPPSQQCLPPAFIAVTAPLPHPARLDQSPIPSPPLPSPPHCRHRARLGAQIRQRRPLELQPQNTLVANGLIFRHKPNCPSNRPPITFVSLCLNLSRSFCSQQTQGFFLKKFESRMLSTNQRCPQGVESREREDTVSLEAQSSHTALPFSRCRDQNKLPSGYIPDGLSLQST